MKCQFLIEFESLNDLKPLCQECYKIILETSNWSSLSEDERIKVIQENMPCCPSTTIVKDDK